VISATAEPATVSARGDRVTIRLRMSAGDRDADLGIDIAPPGYAEGGPPYGSRLEERGIEVEGPGRVSLTRTDPAIPAGTCLFGSIGGTFRAFAELPAGTTTTIVFTYRLVDPPATGDLRVRFTVTGAGPEPLVVEAGPSLRGRGQPALELDRPRVRRGIVTLRGRADPVLRRERVRIAAVRGASFDRILTTPVAEYTTVARARVRPDLTFVARWRPRRAGAYLVVASYPGGRPALAGQSCPVRVLMRPPS
jgi:hypothetical protein